MPDTASKGTGSGGEQKHSTMSEEKLSKVTFDGRTIVDTNVLLSDPKVRQTLAKLAEINKKATRKRDQLTILKRAVA